MVNHMETIIDSRATPDGRIFCELQCKFYYGSDVYSVHVYKSDNGIDYSETHRSYPTGNKQKATTTFKKYCGQYLRQRNKY